MKNNSLALVVEDDDAHANLFTEALMEAGFHVEIVRDGQIALARLSYTIPFVVILDINLPHVSGVELLRHIRSNKRLSQTLVIIASADETTAATLRDSADLVMIKPVSYSQLRDLVKHLRVGNSVVS